ncbi:hypothetical protein AX16_006061 [Volvariella volvacea WC 439]|nr:hypothetical protein AX16_006061 [Volvariella volvacea WC 439]
MHSQTTTPAQSLLDSAFKEIDDEIQRHQQAIIDLRRRRNNLTPVYQLPPEVLSRIFSTYAASFPGSYKWVPVTHVSYHWREVAISSPRLWSSIYTKYSSEWLQEVLVRSKSSPILVSCNYKMNVGDLTEHIARIRRLSFLDISGGDLHDIEQFLSHPAPNLEKLVVGCGSSNSYPLKSSAFKFTPALQRLQLIRCPLQWDTFSCPSLTSLTVNNLEDKLSMNQVFALLRRIPNLQTLGLCSALESHSTSSDVEDRIFLPSLTFLQLGDNHISATSNFLRQVQPSRSATISVSCFASRESPAPLLQTFSTYYSDILNRIQYSNSLVIDCNAYQTSLSALEGFDEKPWLYISVQGSSETHTALQAQLIGLFRHVPLEELATLHVDGPALDSDSLSTLSSAPKLSALYLSSIVGLSVIKWFSEAKPGCAHLDQIPLQDTTSTPDTNSDPAPPSRLLPHPDDLASCASCATFCRTFFPSLTRMMFTAVDFGTVDLKPFFRTLSYCHRLQYGVKQLDCRSCRNKDDLLRALAAAGIETSSTPDVKRTVLKPISREYRRERKDANSRGGAAEGPSGSGEGEAATGTGAGTGTEAGPVLWDHPTDPEVVDIMLSLSDWDFPMDTNPSSTSS